MNILDFKLLPKSEMIVYLNKCNNSYYNGDGSELEDEKYDELYNYFKNIYPDDNHELNVGILPKSNMLNLPIYMGSLNKIKPNTQPYSKFFEEETNYVISEKLDGVSILLHYQHKDCQVYTRGNGRIGQNITHIFKKSLNLCKLLDLCDNTIIRGELIIPKSYSHTSNLRNIISGIVNSKNPNLETLNNSKFIAYSIPNSELPPMSQFLKLDSLGFDTPLYKLLSNSDDLSEILKNWRTNSQYNIDGIVISKNKPEKIIDGTNPKHSIAFKSISTDQIAKTRVKHIEWNISKDGYLKPVIIIDPVIIDNTTINRVTGNNARFILDHNIGPDSELEIIKSGYIIPKVHSVLKSSEPNLPTSEYEWNSSKIDLIQKYINPDILLLHFVRTMNIKGINDKLCKKFVSNGINSFELLLNQSILDFSKLDGLSDKSSLIIKRAIELGVKQSKLMDLVIASNILGRNIGKKRIQLCFDKLGNDFLDIENKEEVFNKLIILPGISDKIAIQISTNALSFREYLDSHPNIKKMYLDKQKQKPNITNLQINQKYLDKIICFSGIRDTELENTLISQGAKVTNSLSKKTSLLIIPNTLNKSNKLQQAETLGITIITIDKFKETM